MLNAFGQDDIRLTNRLKLSIGSKLEHDSVVGWGVEPTARVMASVSPHQRVWAAVSRALRTPSVNDLGQLVRFTAFRGANGVPIVVGLLGNPDYQTERLLATEAGYRIEVEPNLSVDVTVFRGHYSGLPSNEHQAPVFMTTPEPHLFVASRIENMMNVDTSGVEVVGRWTPARWWSVDASYSGLHLTPRPDAASRDPNALRNDGNAPAHQWNLHSSWTIAPRIEIDGRLFHVGRLRTLNIPAYTRADARVEVKVSRPMSIILTGQNLLERSHAEFADIRGVTATLVPRSASVRLLWRY